MTPKNKQSENEQPAEKRVTSQKNTGMQICRPTTAKIRKGEVVVILPRACQDVQYRRYTAITGLVTFIPEAPHLTTGGKKVTARKDGIRTYAPMPAGTEGIRYRRNIRAGGIIQLTPISWPQIRRVTRRKEEEQ